MQAPAGEEQRAQEQAQLSLGVFFSFYSSLGEYAQAVECPCPPKPDVSAETKTPAGQVTLAIKV